MHAMLRRINYVGQNGTMRPLLISVPMVEALVDGSRYFRFEDRPNEPGSGFHVGKPDCAKLTRALRPRKGPPRGPRAPTLRSIVKLAVQCDSAEQLGLELRRRYERAKQRAGIKTGPSAADERELERLLGQD